MFLLVINKRTFYIIATLILGICLLAAVYLNLPGKLAKMKQHGTTDSQTSASSEETKTTGKPLFLNTDQIETTSYDQGSKFFIEYHLDRERSNGRQIELLREIIDNPSSSSQIRQEAQEKLLFLSEKLAREGELERLISARGYRDSTVCLEENNKITIIVQASALSLHDEEGIRQLVTWGTGVEGQNIIILAKD
ncbi:MAG TPA: SpoIIIAH-like family protein [Desulfotomaculum sp.]|nr:SpoIIIAH-like family protein [Desulfotomaculum sp.]